MDERDIYQDFARGPLGYHEAITKLQKIPGYTYEEAKRVVDEWCDELEPNEEQRWLEGF